MGSISASFSSTVEDVPLIGKESQNQDPHQKSSLYMVDANEDNDENKKISHSNTHEASQAIMDIVRHMQNLLDHYHLRTIIYLSLVTAIFVPIFADTLDVFYAPSADPEYEVNQFCGELFSCLTGFGGCILLIFGFVLILTAKYKKDLNYRNLASICWTLAFILFSIGIGNFVLHPNTSGLCYQVLSGEADSDQRKAKFWCSVQYIGRNNLDLCVLFVAIIHISTIWDPVENVNAYGKCRLFIFSIGLLISSLCGSVTYLNNKDAFITQVLGTASFWICVTGYILVLVGTFVSLIMFCVLAFCGKKILSGFVSSWLLIIGVILVQAREYEDTGVYTFMCIIIAADIQVYKNIGYWK